MIEYLKTNKKTFLHTILWVCYWEIVMVFYVKILNPLNITHHQNTSITISYFLIISFIGLTLFQTKARYIRYEKRNDKQLKYILLSFLFFLFVFPFIIREVTSFPQENLNFIMDIKFYYPLFEYKTSLSKLADIIYQQVLILSILLYLEEKVKKQSMVITIFTIAFLIIHIPLIALWGWFSFAFIVPSLFAGIIFSYLILGFKYGLLFSFIVHQAFYLAIGILMRILPL